MSTSNELGSPQAARDHPGTASTTRMFFSVWGQALGLVILGGGACGLLYVGVASIALFFFTIPGGMLLGVVLGLPLGLVLAVLFTRRASPPDDPVTFSRHVEAVGKGIAVLTSIPMNVGMFFIQRPSETSKALALGLVANAVFAIFATALVGRECGHVLAAKQLTRFEITSPPRSPLWQSRIGRSAHQRESPTA
jgi:hypothetical protein